MAQHYPSYSASGFQVQMKMANSHVVGRKRRWIATGPRYETKADALTHKPMNRVVKEGSMTVTTDYRVAYVA